MRRAGAIAAGIGGLACLAAVAVAMLPSRQAAGPDGEALYAAHCASCHGADLEGQPDWQRRLPNGRLPAPPHDASGHTWHHADRELFAVTKYGTAAVVGGGYESDMPGFADALSDDEIVAVLEFIKASWPERERRYQAEATRRDREARRAP